LVEFFTSRDFSVFLMMGLAFIAIGLPHRDRWGKPRRLLNEREIRIQKIIMVAIAILVVLGLGIFLFIAYYY
ncbi:MAG: hypothetical protein WBF08_03330, partial [Candidatus Bathyarchaeia archaeon]